jgi:hypothetical protein
MAYFFRFREESLVIRSNPGVFLFILGIFFITGCHCVDQKEFDALRSEIRFSASSQEEVRKEVRELREDLFNLRHNLGIIKEVTSELEGLGLVEEDKLELGGFEALLVLMSTGTAKKMTANSGWILVRGEWGKKRIELVCRQVEQDVFLITNLYSDGVLIRDLTVSDEVILPELAKIPEG